MSVKRILVGLCFIVSAAAFFVWDEQTSSNEHLLAIDSTASHDKKTEDVTTQLQIAKGKEPDKAHINEKIVKSKDSGVNPSIAEQFQLDTEEFVKSDSFKSIETINNKFVFNDGTVNQDTLKIMFRSPDLELVIDAFDRIPNSQSSSERSQRLSDQMVELLGSDFHSENQSCRGKVCVVEFTVSDSISKEALSKIRDFGSNYVFSSQKQLENREIKYRGVFIETDDPSSLTLSQ